jgi:hypothetical protein
MLKKVYYYFLINLELQIILFLYLKNMTVRDLFNISEEFFTSLGLDPMLDDFWNNSIFEKPTDGREINCSRKKI